MGEDDDKVVRLDRDVFERLLTSQEAAHALRAGEIATLSTKVQELETSLARLSEVQRLPTQVADNGKAIAALQVKAGLWGAAAGAITAGAALLAALLRGVG